ncbi:MAG: 4-hydroxy-tetrahydrodipicolinate reductase [Ruminiclostridium sp.]|nr:4-hydroxy-tetrahydrodipicolinate reductase [Ruminiclostridium sp.]
MVKIAITGANGKMGRVISGLIAQRDDCEVIAGIDINTVQIGSFPIVKSPFELPEKPDVIIDFSHPSALDDLLSYCTMNGVPVVVATTGYTDDQVTRIKNAGEQIPVFFTFNMSLGINLLVELGKRAANVLGGQFDIEIVEKHHNLKKDAPSGTALMIAEAINNELGNKLHYVYDRHSVRKPRESTEIGLHSIRGGTIVGEHDIIFAGHDEVITLSHSAASKEVFANGSINAAIFLSKKDKGLYDMSDLLADA